METNITKEGDTEVTIDVTLPPKTFDTHRSSALKYLGKDLDLKGFRKGKVPEEVLTKHISEEHLLQEMANRAISQAMPDIIKKHAPRTIGRPSVSVTKLAAGNPLEFRVTAAILPEVKLPDYKEIAGKLNKEKPEEAEVSEKEVDEAIEDILKRVRQAEEQSKEQNEDAGVPIIGKGAPKDASSLTDEFVKKLGPFENVSDFKTKLKEQIKTRKQHMEYEKHRLSLIETIAEKADPKVPDVLVESELGKMFAQMHADIQRAGLKLEDYLKQVGKTEDDLRNQWRGDAEKRARIQLVLNEIAQAENIRADQQEVENQTKAILAQHPPQGGDLKHAEMSTKIYVDTMLTNEKVFAFLENQKAEK